MHIHKHYEIHLSIFLLSLYGTARGTRCMAFGTKTAGSNLKLGSIGDGVLPNTLLAYRQGVPTSRDTLHTVLERVKQFKDLSASRVAHCLMVQSGLFSVSILADHLIHAFSSQSLLEGNLVFCYVVEPTIHTWYAIISAYAMASNMEMAFQLYYNMKQTDLEPSKYILLCLLKLCSSQLALGYGRVIHEDLIVAGFELDIVVSNTLVDMYAKCNSFLEAQKIFDNAPIQEAVLWNIMISRYVQYGHFVLALELYETMLKKEVATDKVTLLCIMKACAGMGAMEEARLIHYQVVVDAFESDIPIATTLIDLYGRCSSLVDARWVFDHLPCRTVVSWSAMISGYVHHDHGFHALALFETMDHMALRPDKLMLLWVLKACASEGAIMQGRLVHDRIIRYAIESDVSCVSSLAEMYSRCGCQEEACRVSRGMLGQDEMQWDEILTGYCIRPSEDIFHESTDTKVLCILKACENVEATQQGRLAHQHLVKSGLESNPVIATAVIDMYSRIGNLEEACKVFESLSQPDRICWNAMMSMYVQHGCGWPVFKLYERMEARAIQASRVSFLCILKACTINGFKDHGRLIHDKIVRSGHESDISVTNALVDMYSRCGSLEDARQILKAKADRNAVSWTAMMTGCTQHGYALDALKHFCQMQKEDVLPTLVTFSSVLNACGGIKALEPGRIIHGQIIEYGLDLDADVRNSVVDMYVKCGRLYEAHEVLANVHSRDPMTWCMVIAGCVQQGDSLLALELFEKLVQLEIEPSTPLYSWALKACTDLEAAVACMCLHDWVMQNNAESDIDVNNALVEMYAKFGSMYEGFEVFEKNPNKDAVSWGIIITGYTHHGLGFTALELFERMLREGVRANKVLCASILKACSNLGAITLGRILHGLVIEGDFPSDIVVGNTLVNLYVTCNNLEEAQKVFDSVTGWDTVTWNALIAGYIQHGDGFGALELYEKMEHIAIPDRVTYVCSLSACAIVGAIEKGMLIHYDIIRQELECDVVVGTTLIDMYAKCGRLDEACLVFDELPNRNVASWGAMIAGYARSGDFGKAGCCVDAMQKLAIKLDDRIFSIILSSCSHMGQFEGGLCHFDGLVKRHGDHLNCMADLLGRAGHLDEAEKLLRSVPGLPDFTGWMSLLTSCTRLGDFDLGRRCFDQLMNLDSGLAGGYELLSNLYKDSHMWEDTKSTQDLRKIANAWKKPGKAWTELNQQMHEFKVSDAQDLEDQETYTKLRIMRSLMDEEGYIPKADVMSKLDWESVEDMVHSFRSFDLQER